MVRLVKPMICAISADVLPRATQVKTSTSRSLSSESFGHSPVRAMPANRAAMKLQHDIMGYLPGFATPRFICDVPYVGKRWVHQVARYDRELGISYWTKNYRTGVESDDPLALQREHEYYDPIYLLPEAGQEYWRSRAKTPLPILLDQPVAAVG